MGERTDKKANPEEIERQMRNARNERSERLFPRKEWLTKTRILFFFFLLIRLIVVFSPFSLPLPLNIT